jgi:hypothetical protein
MGKLLAVVARFLPLSLLLALPAVAAAQPTPLTVQRVWTRGAGGQDKTTFTPSETIQFAAQLNNPYGALLAGAYGAQLTITTSFYNDTKPVDILPGISTWTWNTTAPSTEGSYTVTVKAYDYASGTLPEGSATFNVGTGAPISSTTGQSQPSPTPGQSQPTPAWYTNSGGAVIQEDSKLKIEWQNSYIYQHPGNDNLYWYAQITYRNKDSNILTINCATLNQYTPREHIRGAEGIPPDGDGYVVAEETFCSRYPGWSAILSPGDVFNYWAIFHNVPPGGEVSLEWQPYGSSPWVNPWPSPPFFGPEPGECPPELVTLGTCNPPAIPTRQLGDDERKVLEATVSCGTFVVGSITTAAGVPLGPIVLAAQYTAQAATAGSTLIAIKEDPQNPNNYVQLVLTLVPGGSCFKLVQAELLGPNETIISPLVNTIIPPGAQ